MAISPLSYRHLQRRPRLRADGVHTFGVYLFPMAVVLVAFGFYLLGSAVSEPLSSNSASVLVASIFLSLGFVLLSYLLRTAMSANHRTRTIRFRVRIPQQEGPSRPRTIVVKPPETAGGLPYQRSDVDSAWIRR